MTVIILKLYLYLFLLEERRLVFKEGEVGRRKASNQGCENIFSVIKGFYFHKMKMSALTLVFVVLNLLMARQGYKKQLRQKRII